MIANDILNWAKVMGYPGADKAEFKESLKKLSIPMTRQMWAQFVKHVRPAVEVAHMNNQLLVYKRNVEGNPSQKLLNKFDSVSDYEAALKKNKLEMKLGHLTLQQERTTAEIKALLQQLSELGSQSQLERETERKNVDKLRLLRLEKVEINKQIKTITKTSNLFAASMVPFPIQSASRVCEPYRNQVIKFCQSLKRGHEVDTINQCLISALAKPLSFNDKDLSSSLSAERLDLLDLAQNLQKTCGDELEHIKSCKIKVLAKFEQRKEEAIEKLTSSKNVKDRAQAIVLRQIFDGNDLLLFATNESQNYLENWSSKWKNCSSNFNCLNELKAANKMTDQITDRLREVTACVNFSVNNLGNVAGRLVSKIQSVAASVEDTSQIESKVEMITSHQLQLIDAIMKMSFTTKKMHSVNRSIDDYICFELNYAKVMLIKMITNAERSNCSDLPSTIHHGIISGTESAINKEKQEMMQQLREIERIIDVVENKLRQFDNYLDCWNERLLMEECSIEPHYLQLLLKFKSNLNEVPPESQSAILNKVWSRYFT